MMMIQDGPMPTGVDKPLRITGDPYKVHVSEEWVGCGFSRQPRCTHNYLQKSSLFNPIQTLLYIPVRLSVDNYLDFF
jgi:hypothetical protein